LTDHPKRLRVFAGPNGSGKSTVIQSVRHIEVNNRLIDFGTYINADDIAQILRKQELQFAAYGLENCHIDWLLGIATKSGLVSGAFDSHALANAIQIKQNRLGLIQETYVEQVAQIIAECLRVALLASNQKFSFETVFSHPSKVEFMKTCAEVGYKVYFYFVGTNSPEINKYRVISRVGQGGHSVPEQKIEERYYRSMDLLWEAAQHCYQAYFFDNSRNYHPSELIANFKVVDGRKMWETTSIDQIPAWFMKYYVQKAHQNEEL
jgi:predicted ABC-type ATPase